VVAITLAGAVANAHVAPSVDDNNRYLKLTPLGDRVRLAYTVFFGEVPGAGERKTMDANRDGQIDEPEAHSFGDKLAVEVAAALELELDGKVRPVHWTVIDVGMGTSQVAAGSFSVDMVAYVCFGEARGRHRVVVRDRFRIPRPGETEAKLEDSPGVQIEHARVGTDEDPSYDFRFAGPGGPLSDDGLDVEFVAGPSSVVAPDEICPARERRSSSHAVALAAALGGALVLGCASWIFLRRKTKPE
jgi:hypothetical protein